METPFILERVYNASIEDVWQAITEENSMREWYFPQLRQFEPVVGFDFVFLNDGSPYQKQWQVTKVEPGRLLAHSWIYKGYPGSSEVTFELFNEGNKTRLKLQHTGIESFPSDPHFARYRFENGWKQILGSNLENYLANVIR
jgi:uncharacterized protein YndB with AHSA1/START domain